MADELAPYISSQRDPMRWTVRLAAPLAVVQPVVDAVKKGDLFVLARDASGLVFGCRDGGMMLRVRVSVRAHDSADAEVVVEEDGFHTPSDTVAARWVAVVVMVMGLGMPPAVGAFLIVSSVIGLMILLNEWREARQRRRDDFMRVAEAVDRVLMPLREHEAGPYRALGPGGPDTRGKSRRRR